MLKTGFYEFFTYEDVLLIGVVGLVLVLRNWWDLIRYGLRRAASDATPDVTERRPPGRARIARLPRALSALRRIQNRRRDVPRSIRPGHRPVTHTV
jgi:hypothetical protein